MSGRTITRRRPYGDNPQVGARGGETEKRILNAALEVFDEVGYSGARVELITKRAGCSRPAFYQYFSSKDEVFWKLAREVGHHMITLGRSLGPVSDDAAGVATLAEWMDSFTSLYGAYSPVFSAFQAATHDHPETARASGAVGSRMDDALLRAFGLQDHPEARPLASGMAAVIIRCNFYWQAMVATGPMERSRLDDGLSRATHRLFHGPRDGVNIDLAARRGRMEPPAAPFGRIATAEASPDLRPRGVATRRRILDAGASVLPVRGYHNARVDDIVAEADVSHGTFYRYFSDKDAFFRALAEEATGGMIDLLSRLPLDGDAAGLGAWLSEWFDSYRANGGVITTWQEMQESNGDLVPYSRDVAAHIVNGLMAMLEGHGHEDALFDTLVLLALIERLPYRAFTLGYTTPQAAIEAGVAIIRRSILGCTD